MNAAMDKKAVRGKERSENIKRQAGGTTSPCPYYKLLLISQEVHK